MIGNYYIILYSLIFHSRHMKVHKFVLRNSINPPIQIDLFKLKLFDKIWSAANQEHGADNIISTAGFALFYVRLGDPCNGHDIISPMLFIYNTLILLKFPKFIWRSIALLYPGRAKGMCIPHGSQAKQSYQPVFGLFIFNFIIRHP